MGYDLLARCLQRKSSVVQTLDGVHRRVSVLRGQRSSLARRRSAIMTPQPCMDQHASCRAPHLLKIFGFYDLRMTESPNLRQNPKRQQRHTELHQTIKNAQLPNRPTDAADDRPLGDHGITIQREIERSASMMMKTSSLDVINQLLRQPFGGNYKMASNSRLYSICTRTYDTYDTSTCMVSYARI